MARLIEEVFNKWTKTCRERVEKLKLNEEALNKIFIDIYGLNDEIDCKVLYQDVSVREADVVRDIKSLLSYAVGCMFGRYSLDNEGIIYAGGQWDISKYKSFTPDEDNIIPITDDEYLENDIVLRLCQWLSLVYGKDTLEENLEFIASTLGSKGDTSREVIRTYFLREFFQDHCKNYQKRPIYWLFDSGKENGFKALIYMHRYNKDTVGLIRSDYLHRVQDAIEKALGNTEYIIANSTSAVDKARATKSRDKYVKQLSETRMYYQALSHIALQRIELDLDDGVKVNYAKFQGVEVSNEGTKKQTIDLLAKI